MMTFDEFFRCATGHECYRYQRQLAEAEEWPDALTAPTGLGKTAAVVLGWCWRRLKMPDNTPRRLVYCLPMRTLVDQTVGNIRSWIENLGVNAPIIATDIHMLMGGFDETPWYRTPETPLVVVGTQDLLLSRALMRGYAMSRYRWPVDFALLHNDAQWVFDEVQLMDAGLATSTQLEGFRRRRGTASRSRSLWVSATLHPNWLRTVDFRNSPSVMHALADFPRDAKSERVRTLVHAPKPINRSGVSLAGKTTADLRVYAADLAREVVDLHTQGTTTLVVVNTVARAQAVYNSLSQSLTPPQCTLIHSRFRSSDRQLQMDKLPKPRERKDLVVVATQAIEAGIDLSAATLVTELAPLPSLVQRFGRLNRYGELNHSGGGSVHWIDLLKGASSDGEADSAAAPYSAADLTAASRILSGLASGSPIDLPAPGPDEFSHRAVIRSKDLEDLFDTDPDLTGFDVDVSQYIRQSNDTDVRVLWREFDIEKGPGAELAPQRDELCAAPISRVRPWLTRLRSKNLRAYRLDPLAKNVDSQERRPWIPLEGDPWPGLVLLVHESVGGYLPEQGFDPSSKQSVAAVDFYDAENSPSISADSNDSDVETERTSPVVLGDHLDHVADEAEELCMRLGIDDGWKRGLVLAARWHDVGKAHEEFQARLRLDDGSSLPSKDLFAKAPKYVQKQGRPYLRHELASALAFMAHNEWSRDADLVGYMIAAHHGKVRMNLRAFPSEQVPTGPDGRPDGRRFARGVWDRDVLPKVDSKAGTVWCGGPLTLSLMELGLHVATGASWADRTRQLLAKLGPFRLAWLEALVRVADWRASANER